MTDQFNYKYRIPSARLRSWDYGDNGMYFVTICTANRDCFFGEIEERTVEAKVDGIQHEIRLNVLGNTVQTEWLKTTDLRPDMNLELGEFVIMPNHFHGILWIGDNQYNARYPDHSKFDCTVNPNAELIDEAKNKFGSQSKNLASIIRGFKSAVTTYARVNGIEFNWQTRYHDHIIKTHSEYVKISNYIAKNPDNWRKDKFFK